MDNEQLKKMAEILLPDAKNTPEYYEKLFPERNLPKGAKVTRFAPSPTGFMHVGGLYAAMVSSRIGQQSNGVFFLRIEDTDKKREVENGIRDIVVSLSKFGIKFDEGVNADESETGKYGPYKQSDRRDIYRTFAKVLIEKGYAYPCFCSEEELADLRQKQEADSARLGYYGVFATHRNSTIADVEREISAGKSFVLRLKSPGDPNESVHLYDRIKGDIELPENDQDIVLLKSDGIPTYHFAHVVDDHLMRTTTVIRGDEWLSSAPIHLQLFDLMEWKLPEFAHISTIQKEEDGAKRKLSKRKDPEASVTFYHENGIPATSLTEYLLNLANSTFEDWRRDNPDKDNYEFIVQLEKMSVSGALFDMVKLMNISKNIVGFMTAKQVYDETCMWANDNDKAFYERLKTNQEYVMSILNIERGCEKPRKDIGKWSDVRDYISYFFDDEFDKNIAENGYNFNEKYSKDEIKDLLTQYSKVYNPQLDKDSWFANLKEFAQEFGFSPDVKAYKKSPESFRGHIGDIAEILRIALANRKNTPDLHEITKVLGTQKVIERLTIKNN